MQEGARQHASEVLIQGLAPGTPRCALLGSPPRPTAWVTGQLPFLGSVSGASRPAYTRQGPSRPGSRSGLPPWDQRRCPSGQSPEGRSWPPVEGATSRGRASRSSEGSAHRLPGPGGGPPKAPRGRSAHGSPSRSGEVGAHASRRDEDRAAKSGPGSDLRIRQPGSVALRSTRRGRRGARVRRPSGPRGWTRQPGSRAPARSPLRRARPRCGRATRG